MKSARIDPEFHSDDIRIIDFLSFEPPVRYEISNPQYRDKDLETRIASPKQVRIWDFVTRLADMTDSDSTLCGRGLARSRELDAMQRGIRKQKSRNWEFYDARWTATRGRLRSFRAFTVHRSFENSSCCASTYIRIYLRITWIKYRLIAF